MRYLLYLFVFAALYLPLRVLAKIYRDLRKKKGGAGEPRL